jgi:DNA repair ATPase RecN
VSSSSQNPTSNSSPLAPEREQEIRQTQLGDWYSGAWTIRDVERDDSTVWELVYHESGQVLATLPAWAGNICLWMADAHEAVPELLAEVDRLRAENKQLHTDLDGARLALFEEEQENAANARVMASYGPTIQELTEKVTTLETQLAKYVGHEPTLTEEALYAHGSKVLREAADALDEERAEHATPGDYAMGVGDGFELAAQSLRRMADEGSHR